MRFPAPRSRASSTDRKRHGESPARAAPRGDKPSTPPAQYKVVEVSPVSEETLEEALNRMAREGWSFESLHFVSREGSHRPALAYLFFVQAKS